MDSEYLKGVSQEQPNQAAFYKYYGKGEETKQNLLNFSEDINEENEERILHIDRPSTTS